MTTPRELLAQYVTQAQMSSFFIDKMNIANVKSYGATGDGVTDDTDAIQAAIATGKLVFFPQGTYMVSESLEFSSNRQGAFGTLYSVIKGSANNISIIKVTNARVTLRDLAIFTNQNDNIGVEVSGSNADFCYFDNVRVVGKGTYPTTYYNDKGFYINGVSYLTMVKCCAEKCKYGIYDDGGSGAIHLIDPTIIENYIGLDTVNPQFNIIAGTIAHNAYNELQLGVRSEPVYDQQRANMVFTGSHIERDSTNLTNSIVIGDYTSTGVRGLNSMTMNGCFMALNSSTTPFVKADNGSMLTLSGCEINGQTTNCPALIDVSTGQFGKIVTMGNYFGKGNSASIPFVKNFGTQKIDFEYGNSHIDGAASESMEYIADNKVIIKCSNSTESTINTLRLQTVDSSGGAVDRMLFETGKTIGGINIDPAKSYFMFGSTNLWLKFSTGVPEGAVTANIGSMWVRTDGTTGATFYVKEANSGANTGWAAK